MTCTNIKLDISLKLTYILHNKYYKFLQFI
jgi:hypothetical protein